MKLFYRDLGAGEPIVILHGLYSSSDAWLPVAKLLNAQNFRTIIPDLRNHGQSPHSATHLYSDISADIFELVSELKLSEIFLVGHSMGGKAALQFSNDFPNFVRKRIIADIAPRAYQSVNHGGITHNEVMAFMQNSNFENINSLDDFAKTIPQEFGLEAQFFLKNIRKNAKKKYEWKINVPVLKNHLKEVRKEIKFVPICETLFLKGELSDYLLDTDVQFLREQPKTQVITLKNASHRLHSEFPVQVAEVISDYFQTK